MEISYFEGIDTSTVNVVNGVGYLLNGLDFIINTIDNHHFVQFNTVIISFALVSVTIEYTLISFGIGYPSCDFVDHESVRCISDEVWYY